MSGNGFEGKRVLVTGASRGIGRATVDMLREQGAHVAVVGRTHSTLKAALQGSRGDAVIVANLARPQESDRVVDAAVSALGGLDMLVCSAGVVTYTPTLEVTPEEVEQQLSVNFVTPLRLAQCAAPHMQAGASMVFVASTLALSPAPLTAAYAASKAALVAAMRTLALELAPRDIRVNVVAPGIIDTEMIRVLRPSPSDPPPALEPVLENPLEREAKLREQLEMLRRLHPLGRFGQPREVAQSILYLLKASYVTGTVLTVDGGLLLGSGHT